MICTPDKRDLFLYVTLLFSLIQRIICSVHIILYNFDSVLLDWVVGGLYVEGEFIRNPPTYICSIRNMFNQEYVQSGTCSIRNMYDYTPLFSITFDVTTNMIEGPDSFPNKNTKQIALFELNHVLNHVYHR